MSVATMSADSTGSGAKAPKKHQLQTRWCFWLRNQSGRGNDWSQQQTLGHTFGSVEDFWCMINNINNPFEGGNNNIDYSIFREHIVPDYDEECFKAGGRIILKLASNGVKSPQKMFDLWVHLLLALIGENFEEMGGEFVGGLRLVAKRGSVKLEVWTTNMEAQKMEALTKGIHSVVSPLLDVGNRSAAEFESFDKKVTLKVQ